MALKTNVHGLLAVAQHVGPKMTERGEGVIVVTGATASLRGEEKKHVGLDLMMLSQRCCKIIHDLCPKDQFFDLDFLLILVHVLEALSDLDLFNR